jgi:hypothetical protein
LPRKPVEHRQEYVEVTCVVSVVLQVVPRRRLKPRRKPSAHVSAPVNLFKRDVVEREAYKYTGNPAIVENPQKNQEGQGVRAKKPYDTPGTPREVDVSGRIRGLQSGMVHHVLLGEKPASTVQQEPVQAVFESISVDEASQQAEQKASPRRRSELYGNEYESKTRQKCRNQIILLGPQSLGPGFSQNGAI